MKTSPGRGWGPLSGAFWASLVSVSCGGAPLRTEAPVIQVKDTGAPSDVLRYLPLQADTVFSYDTETEGGEPGVLVMQISRPREDRADLRIGSHVERLQIEMGGIAYVEGGFLLRTPLDKGATWRGKSGAVRVAAVDEEITVPAGHFQGCLRTVEESHAVGASKAVTSVYCPHVGLVMLDVEGVSDAGPEHQRVSLRSFGPRIDLGADSEVRTTGEAQGPPSP